MNRIGWAITYLKKACLLSSPKRAVFQITERGNKLFSTNPAEVTNKTLQQYEEFRAFKAKIKSDSPEEPEQAGSSVSMTPEEALEWGYQNLTQSLSEELLSKIASCSPTFFKNLVIELLVKMGYGGSRKEAAQIVGKAGDAGIDGIIKEDKLGLDTIYVQAKRWEKRRRKT